MHTRTKTRRRELGRVWTASRGWTIPADTGSCVLAAQVRREAGKHRGLSVLQRRATATIATAAKARFAGQVHPRAACLGSSPLYRTALRTAHFLTPSHLNTSFSNRKHDQFSSFQSKQTEARRTAGRAIELVATTETSRATPLPRSAATTSSRVLAHSTHLLYSFTRSEDSNSSAMASAGTSIVHHARMHANLLQRHKKQRQKKTSPAPAPAPKTREKLVSANTN